MITRRDFIVCTQCQGYTEIGVFLTPDGATYCPDCCVGHWPDAPQFSQFTCVDCGAECGAECPDCTKKV